MKVYFTYYFIFLCCCLQAQSVADSILIPEINLSDSLILQKQIGSNHKTWNAHQLAQKSPLNVADLLQQETGIYIKSYGNSSLATSSLRGGSSAHTLILWNDIPLNSPMLGLLDLSLLPIHSFESISLDLGGNSCMHGSGAIGGVLSLNNKADFNQKNNFTNLISFGSFGRISNNSSLHWGNKKFQSITRFSALRSNNDFDYFIAENFPRRTQENAQVKQYNLQQDFHFKFKNNLLLSFHYWRQASDRQIPPNSLQTFSAAYQLDQSDRLLVSLKKVNNQDLFSLKASFINENLDYIDPRQLIESLSNFKTANLKFKYKRYIKKHHRISLGLSQYFGTAFIDRYIETPQELRSAIYGSYELVGKRYQWQTSIRQSLLNGKIIPFVMHSGIHFNLNAYFDLKAKIARNYNIPSFNDRYWAQGGNINLLPESGWSQEISFLSNFQKIGLQYNVTAYSRIIKNWILWSPNPDNGFFRAQNLAEVWSRGVEQELLYTFRYKEITFESGLVHFLTRSTNSKDIPDINIGAGDQLIYVPLHKVNGRIQFSYKKFKLLYNHQFTSPVQGQNDEVLAFDVANVQFLYPLQFKNIKARLQFDILNLYNKDYLIIERRPMPGRNYQLGLLLNFTN